MTDKLNIYLCDLVHNYLGAGSYMFPLNIGYLKAYALKHLPDKVNIKLFKYPDQLLGALDNELPDVIGFSHYSWNADLNKQLQQKARQLKPDIVSVFGGPNLDYTDMGIEDFFDNYNDTDFYIPFQGETPFLNLLERLLDSADNFANPIDGVITHQRKTGDFLKGTMLPRIKNPDEIPSPYLTGILDEFFEENLIPIVESNRGCPYTCTFCAQGFSSHNRLDFFSLERVKQELTYVAEHIQKTNIMWFADANFGIHERDIEIAEFIKIMQEKYGFPHKCCMNWAKNQPKILDIAKMLKDDSIFIVSLQSLSKPVLESVKRQNIKLSIFREMLDKVRSQGGISGTEIILGLPGESKEAHLQTLRELFDWNVSYIIAYNALMLKGTELSQTREKYQVQTAYRLIDSSFGKYDNFLSFECEEGIMSTNTMSKKELLSIRPVHWLIQFLWNYRCYYDLLKYLQTLGVNPLDFILAVIDNFHNAVPEVENIFADFKEESYAEWHSSPEELKDYFAKPNNFKQLADGKFGKMNGKYIWRTLLEAPKYFCEYLISTAIQMNKKTIDNQKTIKNIAEFNCFALLDFSANLEELKRKKEGVFNFNVPAWRQNNYSVESISKYYSENSFNIELQLPKSQFTALQRLLLQYNNSNKNVMLRKMTEHMNIMDIFYKVVKNCR